MLEKVQEKVQEKVRGKEKEDGKEKVHQGKEQTCKMSQALQAALV